MARKPKGWISVIELGSLAPHESVSLPDGKAEREHLIAKCFVNSLSGSAEFGIAILNFEQLPQADYDFKVVTQDGDRFLELTEFAPLAGPYADAEMANVGETADQICNAIAKKSAHYRASGTPVILLVYVTHYAFQPEEYVFWLVEHYLRKSQPRFEEVFFLVPRTQGPGELRLLHPTIGRDLSAREIEDYRKKGFVNADLSHSWIIPREGR